MSGSTECVDVRHVLRLAPDAVLGTEQRGELPAAARVQQADGMPEIVGNRALMRDETDPFAVDRRGSSSRTSRPGRTFMELQG